VFRLYEKTRRVVVPDYDIHGKYFLSKSEVQKLFGGSVTVTEKIDGSNTAVIRTKQSPGFRLQKRRSLVGISSDSHLNDFCRWMDARSEQLLLFPESFVIYGEWARYVHLIYYNQLPSWWLIFAIFDRKKQQYLKWLEIHEWARNTGFHTVPYLADGHFDRATIVDNVMPDVSNFGSEAAEGIVIYNHRQQMRGKVVKPCFVKSIFYGDDEIEIPSKRLNKLVKKGSNNEFSVVGH
jgi:ATP-dependent RNA circularization protein (DNA/RNA ligase family)